MSCASSAPNLAQKGDILKITIDNQQVTDGGRVLLNPASATTRVEVQKDFNSFFVQHTQPQQKHFYRLVPQIYT